eukprot:CAMPEP_0115019996 /NCGR_PEP_ID=MMETSP0216-20121206/29820_1 /TAXON_ID=223996 /ORGANISM="Protocruzia adherens, Strain Boccale" /LENGTH=195 /DNA_ID=CAMNT_0002391661 /DNA_START=119 /DNA_END=706 /DNA_ORIENTATION=-
MPFRNLFIQVKPTPNPSHLKFLPSGKPVTGDQSPMDFPAAKYSYISPLAKRLFAVDGVTRVFFGSTFITVAKHDEFDWEILKPMIFEVVTEHYASEQPLFTDEPQPEDTTVNDDDSEVVAMIKEILETRVRPFVQEDGGDITYRGFSEELGMVYLTMKGSCAGCPSSGVTLKNGIEKMLMHYIPEVQGVEAIDNE